MDPLKLVGLVATAGVVTLIAMGGAGFYAGYSAGRGDLSELKAVLASSGRAVPDGAAQPSQTAVDLSAQANLTPLISEIRDMRSQMKKLEKLGDAAPAPDLTPVLNEIKTMTGQAKRAERSGSAPEAVDLSPVTSELKSLGDTIKKLEKAAQSQATAQQQVATQQTALQTALQQLADKAKDDPKLRDELGKIRQLVSSSGDQLSTCVQKVVALEAKSHLQPVAAVAATPRGGREDARPTPKGDALAAVEDTAPGNTVLNESFYLKKDQSKAFQDLDLAVALQGVASRSARVDINKQIVSIGFGERKEIVYNHMSCSIELWETDLAASQARFNIACKK
jgi:hypothetical protein